MAWLAHALGLLGRVRGWTCVGHGVVRIIGLVDLPLLIRLRSVITTRSETLRDAGVDLVGRRSRD
jgi:hypothetical protein